MRRVRIFRKLNNRGAGVVAVIVAIALVSILVSVVLSTSYANFKMKQTNYKTKNNFYSAEQALDEINVGLQNYVSDALSYAYLEVISEYNLGDGDQKNELMEKLYYEKLWDYLATDSTYKHYKIENLYAFVTEPWDDTTQTGALVTSVNAEMITYEDKGIVLKDIEVYYKDLAGFSTFIKTDIRLACPQLQFGSTTDIPDIMNYALVADNGLEFQGPSLAECSDSITGQVYAGYIKAEAEEGRKIKLQFIDNSTEEKGFTIVSKGNMNFKNVEVSFPETGVTWANSVVLNSSKATFRGTTNIANDLMLNGKNSNAVIEDKFNAYGNSDRIADESSSIVINGTGSQLDLTDSEIIAIAGHAFVGTKDVATAGDTMNVGGSTVAQKKGDVLTGESIAVKSNQLLYLLPGDAVGVQVTNEGGAVTYGVSKYGKNPLTKEEYKSIAVPTDGKTYADVNKDYVFFRVAENGKVVEKKFSDFASDVVKVFIPSGKTTMVYYYIAFDSDQKANQFFQYYYKLSPEKLEKYLSFYTTSIKMPDTTNLVRFQTAGNLLTQTETINNVGGTNVYSYRSDLVENTVKGSIYFETSSDLYIRQKKALCTKLVTNYMGFSADELEKCVTQNVVFENLVNVTKFNELLNANSGIFKFTIPGVNEGDPDIVKAILTKNDYVYKGNNDDKDVNLLICSGNVTLEKDFTGLILCNGVVTVEPGVNILKDDVKTKVAFRLQKTVGSDIVTPLTYMIDGTNVVDIGGGSALDGQSLSLPDLIVYENWTKE